MPWLDKVLLIVCGSIEVAGSDDAVKPVMFGPEGVAVHLYVVVPAKTVEVKSTCVVAVPLQMDWLAGLRVTDGIGFTVTT